LSILVQALANQLIPVRLLPASSSHDKQKPCPQKGAGTLFPTSENITAKKTKGFEKESFFEKTAA